jgi:uncharacterized protein
MEQTVRFIRKISQDLKLGKINITFHGGEPLAAGHDFFLSFLNKIASDYPKEKLRLNVQSNLWFLYDAYCALFKKYNVSIGTSLDGPQNITDAQRGRGYFNKTMAGIELAKEFGLNMGCIVTFTRFSSPHWREIVDFFINKQIDISIHTSVPTLDYSNYQYALTVDEKTDLLRNLLDYYIQNRKKISISTFNQMAKSIPVGQGQVCTFMDCLGMFLVIDPTGNIYPCQRFAGNNQYLMGNLDDNPSVEELFKSSVAKRMKEREKHIERVCQDCEHYGYCRGGCCYNAWASGSDSAVDPYCGVYDKTFTYLKNRLIQEIVSEQNIQAVADDPFSSGNQIMLKKGPLIELVRSAPHPSQIARRSKRVVAAVELARGPDIPSVAHRLVRMGICRNQNTALASLNHLKTSLSLENPGLNNLYLHITFNCQLHCCHCYVGEKNNHKEEMSTQNLEVLVAQAMQTEFRQVIVTGGEPLIHSRKDELLTMLNRIKPKVGPMNLVLRTNLAMRLTDAEINIIAGAFHQIVASIDGTREAHDQRRGEGSYEATIINMENYQRIAKSIPRAAELSIATVMPSDQIQRESGRSVMEVALRLGVRRTRFRPLLPLGRAINWKQRPQSEALGAYLDPCRLIENGFTPVATCGIGQNLFVEPSGESFPCYAYHQTHTLLGNVIENGLNSILESERFKDLSRHSVDTNYKCRRCEYRYLCGGACRAWGGDATQRDLDAPPPMRWLNWAMPL